MKRMTRDKAMAEVIRIFGRSGSIKDYGKRLATTPESRAAASAKLAAHRAAKPVGPRIETAPSEMTVGEFRAKLAEHTALYRRWKLEESDLMSAATRRRFSVGDAGGMFFHIYGQGDSWEEVIAAIPEYMLKK